MGKNISSRDESSQEKSWDTNLFSFSLDIFFFRRQKKILAQKITHFIPSGQGKSGSVHVKNIFSYPEKTCLEIFLSSYLAQAPKIVEFIRAKECAQRREKNLDFISLKKV